MWYVYLQHLVEITSYGHTDDVIEHLAAMHTTKHSLCFICENNLFVCVHRCNVKIQPCM